MKENDGPGMKSLAPAVSPPPACSVLILYWLGVPEALLTPPKVGAGSSRQGDSPQDPRATHTREGSPSCSLTCISPCRAHGAASKVVGVAGEGLGRAIQPQRRLFWPAGQGLGNLTCTGDAPGPLAVSYRQQGPGSWHSPAWPTACPPAQLPQTPLPLHMVAAPSVCQIRLGE